MSFFFLSHIIQSWILPPGLNLLLALIGFMLLSRSKAIGISLILISFITLWIFSTPIIAQSLINYLQNQYPTLRVNEILSQQSAAIVVLGGGHEISPDSPNGYSLSDASEFRLRYAAFLYYKTHFPVIVSGGTLIKSSPTEAELMRQEMQNYFHVPVAWEETHSITTMDEANLMVPILEKHKIKIAYLVTNGFHMPRAIYAFQKSFNKTQIKIIPAPMGYSILNPNQGILNFFPSINALSNSRIALHEYIGMLFYHLRYNL